MLYDYQSKLILPTSYNIVVLYYSEANYAQYLGRYSYFIISLCQLITLVLCDCHGDFDGPIEFYGQCDVLGYRRIYLCLK